jgi:glycosyltransferase involved in cell wall biosynthesis
MMRNGDKLSSYAALAKALTHIRDLPWRLSIAGDGPARSEVEALFSHLPDDRISWLGEQTPEAIRQLLASGWLYVWPGHGEAYGLAYLEAQAAGVPVISEAIAGVPEVVVDGTSGMLTSAGDTVAYARNVAELLSDASARHRRATSARAFALSERSIEAAAVALDQIITTHIGIRR